MKRRNKSSLYIIILTINTILLFSILILGGCERDNSNEFVPNYEKGYIIKCKVNGKDWFHYSGDPSHPESISSSFSKSNFGGGLLTIEALNQVENPFNNAIDLWLRVNKEYNQIKWATNDPIDCYRNFYLSTKGGNFRYHLDTSFYNIFILDSFDTNKHEVIGRFDYRAVNTDFTDTVHISSGYFDIFYK